MIFIIACPSGTCKVSVWRDATRRTLDITASYGDILWPVTENFLDNLENFGYIMLKVYLHFDFNNLKFEA